MAKKSIQTIIEDHTKPSPSPYPTNKRAAADPFWLEEQVRHIHKRCLSASPRGVPVSHFPWKPDWRDPGFPKKVSNAHVHTGDLIMARYRLAMHV